jgi:hypothetical protein
MEVPGRAAGHQRLLCWSPLVCGSERRHRAHRHAVTWGGLRGSATREEQERRGLEETGRNCEAWNGVATWCVVCWGEQSERLNWRHWVDGARGAPPEKARATPRRCPCRFAGRDGWLLLRLLIDYLVLRQQQNGHLDSGGGCSLFSSGPPKKGGVLQNDQTMMTHSTGGCWASAHSTQSIQSFSGPSHWGPLLGPLPQIFTMNSLE